jgi:hypothetical protein
MYLFIPGMKRLLIFPLLFFFALNPLAFYLMLEMHKIRMEAETGENNKQGNITILVIPEHNPPVSFQWKDKKEFSFEGKYYDIVKLERKDGKLYFSCIRDINEDTLLAFMKKLTGNKYFSFSPDDIMKMPPPGIRHGVLHSSSEYRFPMISERMESLVQGTLFQPPKLT